LNLVNKDHFILVDLQAKSQTSIDVTDRDLSAPFSKQNQFQSSTNSAGMVQQKLK